MNEKEMTFKTALKRVEDGEEWEEKKIKEIVKTKELY